MKLIDYILLLMIMLVFTFCVKKGFSHVNGEGSCCGGKSDLNRMIKSLNGKVIDSTIISIEGMKCENCAIKIENELNQIDGIKAIVSFSKSELKIDSTHMINLDQVKSVIDRLGYSIKQV